MLAMVEIMVMGAQQEPSPSMFKREKKPEGGNFYLERELEVPILPRIGERFSTPALQSVQECHAKVRDVLWMPLPDGTVRNRVYVHYDMHVHGSQAFKVAAALQTEGWALAEDPHLAETSV